MATIMPLCKLMATQQSGKILGENTALNIFLSPEVSAIVIVLLQVQFDAEYETRARQTPSVLFCTGDGLLCRAQWEEPVGSALTQVQDNGQNKSSSNSLQVSTLLSEPSSVNGFDVGGLDGSEIVAVVDQECVCYIKRRLQSLF